MDYFLRQPNLQRHVNALDILASLLAAMIHDLGEFALVEALADIFASSPFFAGHPGVNNTFLEVTRDVLAITYNDVSVPATRRNSAM